MIVAHYSRGALLSKKVLGAPVSSSTLYEDDLATIPKLAEKLTLELVHHIELSLPRLEEQIEEKLAQTHLELERYGRGPPSEAGQRLIFLMDKVTAFTQDALSLTTGDELKCGEKLNVFSTLRKDFAKWKDILDKSGTSFNKNVEKEVGIYEETYRGKELPGFINYKTFESMVKAQVKQLEEPAIRKLKEAADSIRKMFLQLAYSSFIGFPNLLKAAKNKIEMIKQEKEAIAEKMLRTQFKMEMIVYTQDRTYSCSLHDRNKEDAEDRQRTGRTRSIMYYMDNSATLYELMMHIKSYYQIVSQRLADQIPMVIRYQLLEELAVELQRQMLQMLQDKDNVESLLKEDYDIGSKRLGLQHRHKRLMKAREYLVCF
uniref:GED domain-containing protein n=1 Tax=Knipowitschia caucasica TaxID=637954 RepID=A0AAV2M8V9_KNICA